MLALLLLAAAADAAPPKVALHVSTAVKVTPRQQDEAVAFIERALRPLGLEVHVVDRGCAGDAACLTELGKTEGLDAVVLITFGPAGTAIAVDLEALVIKDGSRPAQATFRFDPKAPGKAEATVVELGTKLKELLPHAPVADTTPPPEKPKPDEAPRDAVVITAEPTPAGPSRAPWVLAGVGAGVGVIGAVTFGTWGLTTQQTAQATDDGVHAKLKEAEVRAGVSRANTYYSLSLGASLLAAALLIAGIAWAMSL